MRVHSVRTDRIEDPSTICRNYYAQQKYLSRILINFIVNSFVFFSVPEDQQMMYLPEIIEESDPDENRSRRTSTCSSKSEGKFTTTKDKNIIDNFGVMR